MNDMTAVIIPKSDQLNSDDLISGPRTIRITGVSIRPGTEQPVSIHFDGDNGKPWKTCKSMNRVLVHAWGPDATAYVGRSVTIYRDPDVKWGGMKVGGIRISHLSNLEREMVMALTETKGKRTPFIVKPLVNAPAAKTDNAAQKWVDDHLGFVRGASDLESLDAVIAGGVKAMTKLSGANPNLHQAVTDAYDARRQALSDADPFEGRPETDHGAIHDDGTIDADAYIARIKSAATAEALDEIQAEYRDTGRGKLDIADQDRVETAMDERRKGFGDE